MRLFITPVACCSILFALLHCSGVHGSTYLLSKLSETCIDACFRNGMNCNPAIQTNNSDAIFALVGANCKSYDSSPWWASDQPSINTAGVCLGYIGTPQAVACQGRFPTVQRVCRCDAPEPNPVAAFSMAYSQGQISSWELPVFSVVLAPNNSGVLEHFWMTPTDPDVTVRYYIDGEANASIVFQPQLACGVGFNDQAAPWGLRWFGKGASTGGWFWNFKVPFHKSARVTVQSPQTDVLYVIVRGTPNIRTVRIGDFEVPVAAKKARLVQQTFAQLVPALAFVPVFETMTGPGLFFMHTLAFEAPNLNTLEACYHFHSPYSEPWPGRLLSSGTEDYFDSAYYFNAGQFHLPVSGFTHYDATNGTVRVSAYRFHEEDLLPFGPGGMRMVWRNGDMSDKSGIKCLIESGGNPNGNPQPANVYIYAWAYIWNE